MQPLGVSQKAPSVRRLPADALGRTLVHGQLDLVFRGARGLMTSECPNDSLRRNTAGQTASQLPQAMHASASITGTLVAMF